MANPADELLRIRDDKPEVGIQTLPNLNIGEVFKRDTSYLGEQTEVRAMVTATKDPNRRWPGYWYEILQGAWDFNSWEEGPPEIRIYYEGESDPITLTRFTADYTQPGFLQRLVRKKVSRVEIVNHIRGESGLRPNNVVLTQHEGKGDDETLGTHGRGLKIATTATYSGRLAEKITFQSWVPEIGAWYGEAGLTRDPIDPKSPEYFQLKYKRDKQLKFKDTVVAVHRPSEELLQALVNLPDWFLPVNASYRFQRLTPGTTFYHPNLMTISANQQSVAEPNDTTFSPHDLSYWGHYVSESTRSTEALRVEILPSGLFSKVPPVIDYVYADGLRVKVEGAKFAQIYAFWGLGKGRSGYNPRRSNDSLKLEGGIRDLFGETLARCTNAGVFADILQANTQETTFEGNIWSSDLSRICEFPQAQKAFRNGWSEVKRRLQIPGTIYVTDSQEAKARADREGKPTVLIKSRAFVEALTENVPDLERIETVFEREAIEQARLLEEERERHEQEIRRLEEVIERERKDKDEQIRSEEKKRLRVRGITSEAAETGEVLKVRPPEHVQDALQITKLHLIHVLATNQGRMIATASPEQFILEMRADDFDRLPGNTNQLGLLGDFIRDFIIIFGNRVDLELHIVRNGRGVYFKFSRSPQSDSLGNYTIGVQQGTLAVDAQSLIRLEFNPLPTGQLESARPEESFVNWSDFRALLEADINSLTGEAGHVDLDRYVGSDFYKNYPPAAALIRLRREMEMTKRQAQEQLAAINAVRMRAGLPPIPDPFAEPVKATTRCPAEEKTNQTGAVELTQVAHGQETRPSDGKPADIHHLDGVDVYHMTLVLVHPDSTSFLSISGKRDRLEMVMAEASPEERLLQSWSERLGEILRRQISPDFTLASGEWSKIRGYLISHINPVQSKIGTQDYQLLSLLPFRKFPHLPRLRFNKTIEPGLHTLLCPPGYQPMAYYHEGRPLEITFSGNLERNVYAFTLHDEVPPGLIFFFDKNPNIDTSKPDNLERQVIADHDGLSDHWKNLISALNGSNLTDKQKVDILLLAWRKAFRYDSSQETFDLYHETREVPIAFATQIINEARGDCGYCQRGFHGLLSLAGIPSREILSFMSDGFGNFSETSNYHGLNQAYIDGRWVLIEPQVNYLESGYEIEDIPAEHRQEFQTLLKSIPRSEVKMLESLPAILPTTLPPIATLWNETVTAIWELLPLERPQIPNPLDLLKLVTSQIDLYGRSKLTKIAAASVVAALIATKMTERLPSIVQAAPALGPLQVPQIPIELLISALLLGGGSFYAGRRFERRKKTSSYLPRHHPDVLQSVTDT